MGTTPTRRSPASVASTCRRALVASSRSANALCCSGKASWAGLSRVSDPGDTRSGGIARGGPWSGFGPRVPRSIAMDRFETLTG